MSGNHGITGSIGRSRLRSRPARAAILAVALMSIAATAATAACGGEVPETAETTRGTAVSAQIATAEARDVTDRILATGSVEPWLQVSPGTKIMGRIEEVRVHEGQRVRRSQVLAVLENRDLVASVEQANAAVTMAEARLQNARAQHDRIVSLHERGSATDKSLEDAVAGLRVAEAGLEQAHANVTAAQVMLEYAEIRAPIDGWVIRKMAEVGDMASPGMPLFVLEGLSRIKVAVAVAEADVVGMEPGDPATVRIGALDRDVEARIDRIVPSADPGSRTFQVKVVIDNPDGSIRSGMFARVRFARGTRSALLVPDSAVVRRGQLRGVFVVEDGVARIRWLKLGGGVGEDVEVLSGLEPGERYLVSPPAGLVDGTPVSGS